MFNIAISKSRGGGISRSGLKVLNFHSVESPSDDLTRLRDYLDSKRCLCLAECVEILKAVKQSVEGKANKADDDQEAEAGPPNSKRRRLSTIITTPAETQSIKMANDFYQVVRKQLKLSRTQSRRIYQILLFFLLTYNKPNAMAPFRRALLKRTRIINGVGESYLKLMF